jgi:hypothetical protein
LNGRKSSVTPDLTSANSIYIREESKLKVGIRKLVRVIYDANGKLKSEFKTSEADLMTAVPSYKKTLLEKLEDIKLQQKMLENPTDHSGTEDRMVQHNVKNAPKYVAAQRKRTLMKQLTQAVNNDNMDEVLNLRKQIRELNDIINRS